jgi:hypothetical protein
MTSNGKIPTHTDRVRELAKYIAEQPDDEPEEITAEHIIEAMKAGAVIATGSHAAMSKARAEEITLTDHGVPKSESVPPKAKFALAVLDRLPAYARGPVVLVALGIVGIVLWRGGSLAGLWP